MKFRSRILFLLGLVFLSFLQSCTSRNFSTAPLPAVTNQIQSKSQYIDNSVGGSVSLPDGAGVQIPAGAFNQSTTVSISRNPVSAAPNMGPNFLPLKYVYYFNSGGAVFAGNVTMSLPYSVSDLPNGHPENTLLVVYYNGSAWASVPSALDTAQKTLTVVTNHFSPWAPSVPSGNGNAATATPTFSATPTFTYTPTGTWFTSTPTPTPTGTYYTNTFTPTDTWTFTPVPTSTYTPCGFCTSTFTPTWSITYTPTFTPTGTWLTSTPTPTPTGTYYTATFTPTDTWTFTPIPTSSDTPCTICTFTFTPTRTWYTSTFTPTPTSTNSFTPTYTGTSTPTPITSSGFTYVNVAGSLFNPSAVTILAGSAIIWNNTDAWTHAINSTDGGAICSSNNPLYLNAGAAATMVYTVPGLDYVHCAFHSACGFTPCDASCEGVGLMTMRVMVLAATLTPTPTGTYYTETFTPTITPTFTPTSTWTPAPCGYPGNTCTPTPVHTSNIIGDFEDQTMNLNANLINSYNGNWSSIPSTLTSFIDTPGANGTTYAAHVFVAPAALSLYNPYEITANLNNPATVYNLAGTAYGAATNGIQFYWKTGTGDNMPARWFICPVSEQLPPPYGNCPGTGGGCYDTYKINMNSYSTGSWTLVQFTWAQFNQAGWGFPQVGPLSGTYAGSPNLSRIVFFQWEEDPNNISGIYGADFWLDEVQFF